MTKEWIVSKTVTEYHVFTIEADTLEKAEEIADDNEICYCDTHSADDTFVEVVSVKEKETNTDHDTLCSAGPHGSGRR